MKNLNDTDLMERVKNGKKDAFEVLVRRYQESLLNFFLRLGAYKESAEDLVQESFLRLFNYRLKYRPSAKFTTFLYKLARHAWIDEMRKTKARPQITTELSIDQFPSNSEHVLQTERRIDIQEALDGLSEKLHIVVVMSVYQRLKYQEIAEVLGISLGTVKSRIFYAFQQLKEKLVVTKAMG